ncbi:extracellular serine-rich protein [Metarhizium album ARSEF 1941]|uniref:Extracellular serine-rich protein n=1 Tax=Metarhizium album (strain ARSEF 1941) TaxID=1081103 RepID=A0A0B2WRU1_METAS|nr:extracellular serine-rich protein [Metarhizium album ARSEF 1941]KHN95700.1 extracellular serine-rich protein [Metarhizium album ARSEF 1941]
MYARHMVGLGSVLVAAAAVIRVDVGSNGAFTFTPDTIKANVGDTLDFHFHPLNHSVVMGDFGNPCAPAKTGGFFSGFLPVSSGQATHSFQVKVNSTDPVFFYCAQTILEHCRNGMAGVVNPSSSQTLGAYKNAAKSVGTASHPASVFGGTLVSTPGPTSASASPSPASTGGGAYAGDAAPAASGAVAALALAVAAFLV